MFCRTFALRPPLRTLGGRLVRSRIELVRLAEPAYTAYRCLALVDGGEPTIAAPGSVNSAPFIRVSYGGAGEDEQRCHGSDRQTVWIFSHDSDPRSSHGPMQKHRKMSHWIQVPQAIPREQLNPFQWRLIYTLPPRKRDSRLVLSRHGELPTSRYLRL